MRAISRFASLRRAVFSSAPAAAWKRRLNSSCRVSASRSRSSSSVRSPMSLARKQITALARHELRLDRELLPGETERLLGERLRDAGELEHHPARLDDGNPALRRALPLPHAGLRGLLGERLVREDVDPHLPAALDLARHRNTSGLDLPVGDPAVLERLDAVLAELHGGLALRLAAPTTAVHLAELRLPGQQHQSSAFLRRVVGFFAGAASASGAGASSTAGASAAAVSGATSGVTSGVSTTVSWAGAAVVSSTGGCSAGARRRDDEEAPRERSEGGRPEVEAGGRPAPDVDPDAAPRPRPPPPRCPGRPRRTGPSPSRSCCRPRPDSRDAPSPSVTPPRRRAVSWSPRRVSRAPPGTP